MSIERELGLVPVESMVGKVQIVRIDQHRLLL